MYQILYEDLPVMSTEVLALRKQLWEAEGYHLIFNVPLWGKNITKTGPLVPFAGLCVSFLVLLRKDYQRFCPQLGDRPYAFQVGYAPNGKVQGLIAIENIRDTIWVGYEDPSFRGFPAGYYYVYFYFKDGWTLNGFINNMHLASDNANRYEVSKASANVLFGQDWYHEVETLEVHWVVWDNLQKKGLNPSRSLQDKLFVPDGNNAISSTHKNIFTMRTGTVLTVVTMYRPNTSSNKNFNPENGKLWAITGSRQIGCSALKVIHRHRELHWCNVSNQLYKRLTTRILHLTAERKLRKSPSHIRKMNICVL